MPLAASTNIINLQGSSNLVASEYDVTSFIETLRRKLVVVPMGRRNDIPRHAGDTIRWHIFNNPTASTGNLVEGSDPSSANALSSTVVTDSILIYGDYFEITDEVEIATINGTKQAYVDAAAYQAALTLDTLALTALALASNTNDAGTALKAEDIRAAASELEANNAMRHPGTPGGQFFCMVASAEACYDLIGEGAPTWYQAKAAAFEDNLTSPLQDTPASAAVYNTIVKMSTNINVATSTTDVDDHENYVLAKDSFGVSGLESNILQPEVMIVPPSPSLASPLGMRGTIGWKARFCSIILDNNRLVEVLSDVTGT